MEAPEEETEIALDVLKPGEPGKAVIFFSVLLTHTSLLPVFFQGRWPLYLAAPRPPTPSPHSCLLATRLYTGLPLLLQCPTHPPASWLGPATRWLHPLIT